MLKSVIEGKTLQLERLVKALRLFLEPFLLRLSNSFSFVRNAGSKNHCCGKEFSFQTIINLIIDYCILLTL